MLSWQRILGHDRNKKKEFGKLSQFDLCDKEISKSLNLNQIQTSAQT